MQILIEKPNQVIRFSVIIRVMKKGKFIVIEGIDGSGKGEQFKLLLSRLKREGFKVATFDFPQYGKPSAFFVERYLNGRYGTLKEVGSYKASVFYALDRFDVAPRIQQWLGESRVVVSNRYVPSNMGHQGAKLKSAAERKKYLRWVYEFEYGIMGIPKPDISVVLHVPAHVAYGLIGKKRSRKYLMGKQRDIHEGSIEHLERAEQTYLEMAKMFPKDFVVVECTKDKKLLTIEEIHEKVWKEAMKLLAKR